MTPDIVMMWAAAVCAVVVTAALVVAFVVSAWQELRWMWGTR